MYTPSPTQSIQARQFQQQMPMQQMQNGLPPQLLQMITEAIAAETVQKATQAAQGQVAQAMGGPQPTVADSIKSKLQQVGLEAAQQKLAMGSNGHAEMQQKAQGLAAIANQGQNVPQAQGAPQGPQPIQRMAAGGLARLPSNLPSSYAGGGIIAFDEGGATTPPVRSTDGGKTWTLDVPDTIRDPSVPYYREIVNPNAALGDKKFSSRQEAEAAFWNKTVPAAEIAKADAAMQAPAPTAPTAPLPDDGKGVVAAAAAAKAKAEAQRQAPRPVATAQAQPNILGGMPVARPEATEMSEAVRPQVIEQIGIDPKAVGKTDSEEYAARYAAQLGPEQAALRASRQQDYDTAKAAHEARMAKSEPGWADRFSALGASAAFGNWGKGGQAIREMELAHEATKAGGLEKLMAQKQASDAMNLADKTKAFEGTEAARSAGRTAAAAQQEKGLAHGTSILGDDTQDLTRRTDAWTAAQGRILQAQENHARASQAALERGDMRTQAQLAASYTHARTEAAATAKAEAEQFGRNPMNLNKPAPDINARTQEIQAEILKDDHAYQKALKDLGIVVPEAKPITKIMSQADVERTAKERGKTIEEVKAAAKANGFTIQ